MLKIAFIPSNVSGVVFYRAWQPYQALLRNRNILVEPLIWWFTPNQFTLHPWENEVLDPERGPVIQRDIESAVAWADVVVWMVLHSPQSLQLFKHLRAKYDKQFITEVDDYLFSIPENNAAFEHYKPGQNLVKIGLEQMKMSDGLITSTPYLKDLYSTINKKISVVENVINLALWRKHNPSLGRRRVVLGWVGGGGHEADLQMIKEPLFEILEKNSNVTFNCVHGVPSFFKDHPKIAWTVDYKTITRYPAWVQKKDFDIGLAPLVDNNFNRAKSNLRYLEYSAMAIPTVASAVDHFQRTIRDGDNGLLAITPEDWKAKIQYLIDNVQDRLDMGRRAHEDVKSRWNINKLASRYLDAIEEIIDAKSHTFDTRFQDTRENPGYRDVVAALH